MPQFFLQSGDGEELRYTYIYIYYIHPEVTIGDCRFASERGVGPFEHPAYIAWSADGYTKPLWIHGIPGKF